MPVSHSQPPTLRHAVWTVGSHSQSPLEVCSPQTHEQKPSTRAAWTAGSGCRRPLCMRLTVIVRFLSWRGSVLGLSILGQVPALLSWSSLR